jgi:porphobilinogen synthase
MGLIADLCLCEYTDHGHCGALATAGPGAVGAGPVVANDPTLELYRRVAVAQAEAGATVVAPSGMMDGQVAAIRGALDEAGFAGTPILAYAAKYASGLYGPFREAAEGAPRFGDRTGYQMDPANGDEALREVALDVAEGADMVMVKPALAYLDVLWRVKQAFGLPTAAYHVSGEYAMVKAAAERGWVDGERVMLEVLTSIRRAGADLVVTYFARDAAPLL